MLIELPPQSHRANLVQSLGAWRDSGRFEGLHGTPSATRCIQYFSRGSAARIGRFRAASGVSRWWDLELQVGGRLAVLNHEVLTTGPFVRKVAKGLWIVPVSHSGASELWISFAIPTR